MADLPEAIVVEILSRLPVESIVRFKSVCKSWYALVKNPKFAARHLANQSTTMDHIILKRAFPFNDEEEHDEEDEYYFVLCYLSSSKDRDKDDDEDISSSVVVVDLPASLASYSRSAFMLVGHCNGLVAQSDGNEGVFICNPATREFRTLPNSSFHPIPFKKSDTTTPRRLRTIASLHLLGFGYDSITKDYKVVRVFTYFTPGFVDLYHRAEVLSLGTDSSWRQINYFINARNLLYADGCQMERYFNGIYYWFGRDGKNSTGQAVLISFNMADEVFRKDPAPDLDVLNDYHTFVTVGVYNNESIALYIYPQATGGSMDVWVMKEFGVKESWTKVLTMEPLPERMVRPIAFWKNDEELLLEDVDGHLCSYDFVTLEYKRRGLGYFWSGYTWSAVPYMKTIVSVNSSKEEGIVPHENGRFFC